jgi:hypothetical protein
METFWYIALAFMIIMYVILDGFDLGTGIFFIRAAKTDNERRTLLNAIGPVWQRALNCRQRTVLHSQPRIASGFTILILSFGLAGLWN